MNNKLFSIINIVGFIIGFCATIFIGLIIYYETTFEYFHPDKEHIYRVVSKISTRDNTMYNSGVTVALKEVIEEDNLNVDESASLINNQPISVTNPETSKVFELPKYVRYTEQTYFDIFKYNFIAGNSEDPLSKPNQVVLTKSRARKYFPDTEMADIIGKKLLYDSIEVSVSAIVEELPNRTDIIFQEFISWHTIFQTSRGNFIKQKNWNSTTSDFQLFIKTADDVDLSSFKKKLDGLSSEHAPEDAAKYNYKREFVLQPLSDLHFNEFYPVYDWGEPRADKSLLSNFGLIAGFLLLLSCINFINLSTAQSLRRVKEIGIKKTIGSSRVQLIWQFMGETFILVFISAIISIVLLDWLLKVLSDFVPRGLDFSFISDPVIVTGILVLVMITTLLSGIYPAIALSKHKPLRIIKKQFILGNQKASLRKLLIIFQFTIAQIFIIGTLLVGNQINFMLTKDMGFNTEAVVSVNQPFSSRKFSKLKELSQKVEKIDGVKDISLLNNPPASNTTIYANYTRKMDSSEIVKEIYLLHGDTSYTDVFDIKILAGSKRQNDTVREILMNETATKTFGYKNAEDAVGQFIIENNDSIKIVGVMEDFHQSSLHNRIMPLALAGDWYRPGFYQFKMLSLKLNQNENQSIAYVIDDIRKVYNSVYPNTEMNLEFMDETVESFYQREKKISKLLRWATGLSILISCLGLFGLVIFTTSRRVKEIGVRKVVGASVFQIYILLSKEFIGLIGIAFIIAAPIAYFGTYKWLDSYSYKIDISWEYFLLGGLSMIIFSLLVMSFKTIQAATSNPVNSLRSE